MAERPRAVSGLALKRRIFGRPIASWSGKRNATPKTLAKPRDDVVATIKRYERVVKMAPRRQLADSIGT
jgi:hypothetical protein